LLLALVEGTLLARKYRLARRAGFGGMAELWVATNEATGAEVCVKVLVLDADDEEAAARFRREAAAAARLSHRAIVRVFDLVELDEQGDLATGAAHALAIVMELLHGETLGDLLARRGRLPVEEAIDIAVPVVSALAHAHRAGVVHRDVKPDNIFLAADPDGHVIPKVLDFGVSKLAQGNAKTLTLEGVRLGTPAFMSPEQARGERNVAPPSDVFSFGIVFHMMLAGSNPFDTGRFHDVVAAVIELDPPTPSGLPVPIANVLTKALAKDPAARYADATELGIALRRAAGRTSTTDASIASTPNVAAGPPSSPSSRDVVVASEPGAVPAKPLGGDSIVTVPPAGEGEADTDAPDPLRGGERAARARRRAGQIVAGIVGVSAMIVAAAFLRSPKTSSATPENASHGSASGAPRTSSPARTTTTAPPGAPDAPPAPASASTAATSPSAVDDGARSDAGTAGGSAVPADPEPPAAPHPRAAAPPSAPPSARRGGGGGARTAPSAPDGRAKEPSIVRDPGF